MKTYELTKKLGIKYKCKMYNSRSTRNIKTFMKIGDFSHVNPLESYFIKPPNVMISEVPISLQL